MNFDDSARAAIVRPLRDANLRPDVTAAHRGVVTGRLSSPKSTVLPIVNMAEQHDGTLKGLHLTVHNVSQRPGKVWSAFHQGGVPFEYANNTLTITLPALQTADFVVIENPVPLSLVLGMSQ